MEATPFRRRPKLSAWLNERSIPQAAACEALEISPSTLRRILLPFDHPDRRLPSEGALRRIVALTKGEIGAADFYAPDLRGGDPQTLRAARAL